MLETRPAPPAKAVARFEQVACDACASILQQPLYAFDFDGERAAIVRCGSCGLAYSAPRPTSEALGGFYGANYYSFGVPSVEPAKENPRLKERLRHTILARHFGYTQLHADAKIPYAVSSFMARFLALPDFVEGGVLLDVGCGSGERMLELAQFGWQAKGLEYSQTAADHGKLAGLDISVGDLTRCDFADDSFAAITFYHSLEHVSSPRATLARARQLLRPGGQLLIAVPNFGSGERKIFGRHWGWLQMPTHLFHFDKVSLTQSVRAAGFSDVEVRYSFHGYSVDSARLGAFAKFAEPLLKVFALASAFARDGKALTLVARKPD